MKERTVLYRLYTAGMELLYIGVSSRVEHRLCCEHLVDKHWFTEVEVAKFEHFDLRWRAEEAERAAIIREAPLYNVAHNEMVYGGRKHAWETVHDRLDNKRELEEEMSQ
jgi:hypothetical protein